MQFKILSLSSSIFHFLVRPGVERRDLFCLFVHGPPNWRFKEIFWEQLIRLGGSSDLPWVCIGDFNEVMWQNEKSGERMVAVSFF